MMRTLLRALAVLALAVGIPVTVAAATTYYMLDGTDWTNPAPAASTGRTAPTPAPAPSPASSWSLGTCLTPKLAATECRPGVWQLVAVVQHPGPDPCKGVTSHPDTRYADGLALCLTRY